MVGKGPCVLAAGPVTGEGGAAGGPRSVLDPPPLRHPRRGGDGRLVPMPELPEVEITVRRLNTALSGACVESALAPGMNVMKTFEPGLVELVGREVSQQPGAKPEPDVDRARRMLVELGCRHVGEVTEPKGCQARSAGLSVTLTPGEIALKIGVSNPT